MCGSQSAKFQLMYLEQEIDTVLFNFTQGIDQLKVPLQTKQQGKRKGLASERRGGAAGNVRWGGGGVPHRGEMIN